MKREPRVSRVGSETDKDHSIKFLVLGFIAGALIVFAAFGQNDSTGPSHMQEPRHLSDHGLPQHEAP